MQTLREMNVEKSLEVLEDFVTSVPAGHIGPALKEKKRQAEAALVHIRKCLSEGESEGNSCHAGLPSQKPPS